MENFEVHQFAHPKTTGIYQLQHSAVSHTQRRFHIRGQKQVLDLCLSQCFGHPHRLLGRQHFQRGVITAHALAQCPSVKPLQYRQAAIGRCGFSRCMSTGKVFMQVCFFCR